MDDFKVALKKAREAIKNKDYGIAMYHSKSVLREDKNNYMALVFMGLSIQETGQADQAPAAFRKAIHLNPGNPLAYSGLINLYEKLNTDESKKQLVPLYKKILTIEPIPNKICEYCEKLANLYKSGDISDILESIYQCAMDEKLQENSLHILAIFVKLYKELNSPTDQIKSWYGEALLRLTEKENAERDHCSDYLNFLYKKNENFKALEQSEKLIKVFESDALFLVWFCKIFNQQFIENPLTVKAYHEKSVEYSKKLLELEDKNAIGLFTKSIILLRNRNILEAKDLIEEVTVLRPGLIHAWVHFTNLNVSLNLYDYALDSASAAKKLIKNLETDSNKKLNLLIDSYFVEILSNSRIENNWTKSLEIFKNIDDETTKRNCLKFCIVANMHLGKFIEAKLLISDLRLYDETSAKILSLKWFYKQKMYREALDLVETDSLDSTDWWLQVGSLYWEMEEYKKCLVPYLKAAKSNPENYLCFLNLGNYYQKMEDLDKARRCYEKAFKLNPKSTIIGTELCKVYRELKNYEATQNLLDNITKDTINKRNSWAWLQLGLSYLDQEEYDKAIEKLRFVVRIEIDNVHCWEALADAYFARGSYTSALKCYQKSLELTKNPLYSSLQIANIKKILGEYAEARKDFEEILFDNRQYVPALKGLAETCMSQARLFFRDQRLGTARDHSQAALDKLSLAVLQRSELSCLWKLIGDCCLFVAKLPEKYSCLLILKSVHEGKDKLDNKGEKDVIETEECYVFAARCYCKALTLSKDNVFIWQDLGNCYLNHALNSENPENTQQLLSHVLSAAKHCASIDPTNFNHWNLLGCTAMLLNPPNYSLAQHAFIKAVTADHNAAVSWCNLGVLYLLIGDVKLANQAFSQGQRSDPAYVNSWIGQAFIAEMVGHEEAMDLFRHSTQLKQHQQGGLGYAHWVCQTLLKSPPNVNIYSIHNMDAIPVACDALTWYTEKSPYDGCAWNMLGILRERMGLKESTLEAFKNAYRLCSKEQRDLARVNYGRILAKLGKYSEALEVLQEVQEATFNSGSEMALALFNDKQYEASYEAYEQALHWLAGNETVQSDILVALASMMYMIQGPDNAKTLLFQSIELKPPSPWSLYATLSLALLHNDLKLAKLVLDELENLKDDPDCLEHYAVLLLCLYLKKEEPHKAVKEISKLVHRHPNNLSVWSTLASCLMKFPGEASKAAAACAQVTMKYGRADRNMDITKVMCLISTASMLAGDQKQALTAAQKAVHCYPNVAEGWAALVCSLNHKSLVMKTKVEDMIKHVLYLNPSRELINWRKQQQTIYLT